MSKRLMYRANPDSETKRHGVPVDIGEFAEEQVDEKRKEGWCDSVAETQEEKKPAPKKSAAKKD